MCVHMDVGKFSPKHNNRPIRTYNQRRDVAAYQDQHTAAAEHHVEDGRWCERCVRQLTAQPKLDVVNVDSRGDASPIMFQCVSRTRASAVVSQCYAPNSRGGAAATKPTDDVKLVELSKTLVFIQCVVFLILGASPKQQKRIYVAEIESERALRRT